MGMSDYIRDIRDKIGHGLLQMPSAAAVVFDDAGRILLIKHRDTDTWVTPGGAIEPGETPAEAAVREMWEETGLVVRPVRILGVFGGPEFVVEYSNGDRTSYVIVAFEARVVGGKLKRVTEESADAAYFSREEAQALPTQQWFRKAMPQIFARTGETVFEPTDWRPGDESTGPDRN